MKKQFKQFLFIILSVFLSHGLFAGGFLGERIFEFRVDNDLGISTNNINLGDYLKKEVVIDLAKIAKETPDTGWEMSLYENPLISTKVNIGKLSFALNIGINSIIDTTISKDLIQFLGVGNQVGEDINSKIDIIGDVFAFMGVDVKYRNKLFSYTISPSLFIPVMHVSNEKSYINIINTEDGKLIAEASVLSNVYTNFSTSDVTGSLSKLYSHIGFDLGGSITVPIKKFLDINGMIRLPVVPGTLGYVSDAKFDFSYETSVSELAEGAVNKPSSSFSFSKDNTTNLKIHRPLKIMLGADFYPFLDFMSVTARLGMGVRNPFSQIKGEVYSYMEYYLAFTVSLQNILIARISTEYTDEIFIQKLTGIINTRPFELDLGISLQSAALNKSFSLSGLGIFIGTAIGF